MDAYLYHIVQSFNGHQALASPPLCPILAFAFCSHAGSHPKLLYPFSSNIFCFLASLVYSFCNIFCHWITTCSQCCPQAVISIHFPLAFATNFNSESWFCWFNSALYVVIYISSITSCFDITRSIAFVCENWSATFVRNECMNCFICSCFSGCGFHVANHSSISCSIRSSFRLRFLSTDFLSCLFLLGCFSRWSVSLTFCACH